MSSTIECLVEACDLLQVPTESVGNNGSVVLIGLSSGRKLAFNSHLGLLTDAEWRVFRDKFYSYELFGESELFPPTFAFIDPLAPHLYFKYIHHANLDEILGDIQLKLKFPLIVKRNSGTQGSNVFICNTHEETRLALVHIYSKQQLEYDHVALAQAYIPPKYEYRLVVFDQRLQFAYLKPHHRPEFGGPIAPDLIEDAVVLDRLSAVVGQLNRHYPLLYAGVDVIESQSGEMRVIEINGSPTYAGLINNGGRSQVVELFKRIVAYLDKQSGRCPLA